MFLSRCLTRHSSSVLPSYFLKNDWSGAVQCLESLPTSSQIPPDQLSLLMSKLYSNNKHTEAYKLLLLLPGLGKEPDEIDYTLAIEVCLHQNKVIQALNIFYQSQIFGVALDANLYSVLISSCTKEIGARNIKWILACMHRDQVIISIQACVAALKLGIMIKDSEIVEIIVKVMHQAKYELPNKLVNNFIMRNMNETVELKSLKNVWQHIQQNSFSEPSFEKEKTFELNLKDNSKVDSKNPLSFELIVLPRENHKQIETMDSSPDEESGSD